MNMILKHKANFDSFKQHCDNLVDYSDSWVEEPKSYPTLVVYFINTNINNRDFVDYEYFSINYIEEILSQMKE